MILVESALETRKGSSRTEVKKIYHRKI